MENTKYCNMCKKEKINCHCADAQSPHQEPVATQKEEESDCCGASLIQLDGKLYCRACRSEMKDEIPTQEPMEWAKEFDNKFNLDESNGIGVLPSLQHAVKQFIQNQIKQAEERHNQDCTREEWKENIERIVKAGYDSMLDQKVMEARASERERIVKEVEKCFKEYQNDSELLAKNCIFRTGMGKEDIINLITNQ